jgi:hypothetical protein
MFLVFRAIKAGSKSPVLVVPPSSSFPDAWPVTVLGTLQGLYVVNILLSIIPVHDKSISFYGKHLRL